MTKKQRQEEIFSKIRCFIICLLCIAIECFAVWMVISVEETDKPEIVYEETESSEPEVTIEESEVEIAVTVPATESTNIEQDKLTLISLGEFNITAYCSCKKCCGKWADSRPIDEDGNEIVYGASGAVLIPEYSVAVDPMLIPYGTKLYIDGKEYIAHDCGSAIKGNDIDVYFKEHQEAWDFAAGYYKAPTEVYMIVEEETWEQ